MNRLPYWRAAIAVAILTVVPPNPAGAQSGDDPITLSHTSALELSRDGNVVTAVVTDPWPNGPVIRYRFVPRSGSDRTGTTIDDAGEVRFSIPTPVHSVVSLSTTALPHLRDLDALHTVVAVDTKSYIYDPSIRGRIDDGAIKQVGSGGQLNLERIVALQPDLVIASVYASEDPTLERIEGAGIPVLVLADWREQNPLGRAEWIKLFGVLFDRQEEARRLFKERAARYQQLTGRTAGIDASERPTVMLNAPWQGTWAVPAGHSYMAQLFEDAGAGYLWADTDGTGSLFLDLESVLATAGNSDYWFNLNFGWESRQDAVEADPRLAAFRPYQTGRMYHYNRRTRPEGANDFWETGSARPDLILADLIRILHPELAGDHRLHYYRQVDQ